MEQPPSKRQKIKPKLPPIVFETPGYQPDVRLTVQRDSEAL
ncbi:hypothetical protein LZ554_008288 [Drepanopeziza brunnea f. sp. 'monogermtubi']|nr:hypothetical protein LZ554_008288 [Drepanopeziza brunnea f. sp. 'monogermtubi']